MLALLIFILPAILAGLALLKLNLIQDRLVLVFCGVIVGWASFSQLLFLYEINFGLSRLILWISSIIILIFIVLIIRSDTFWESYKKTSFFAHTTYPYLIALCLLSLPTLRQLVYLDGDLGVGLRSVYGDIPFHVGVTNNFVEGQSFPVQNPLYAGTPFYYPFMSNFFSAILMKGGLDLPDAICLPIFVLLPGIVPLAAGLFFRLTNSSQASWIGAMLLLFSGSALGFTSAILPDLSIHNFLDQVLERSRNYLSGYSHDPNNYFLPNAFIGLMLMQRGLVFGMALALSLVLILFDSNERRGAVLTGLICGLLPLFHAHTILALSPVMIGLFIFKLRFPWWIVICMATFTAIPAFLQYSSAQQNLNPIHLQLGWRAEDGTLNFIRFWFKQSGFLLPLSIVSLFIKSKIELRILTISGLIIFTASNIWRFAVWDFDNTKLLVYWQLYSIAGVSLVLSKLITHKRIVLSGVALLIFVLQIFSASLDYINLLSNPRNFIPEWREIDLEAAELLKLHTPKRSVILSAPTNNNIALLAGRISYLGFPGIVWIHGLPYAERQADIQSFFSGMQNSELESKIDYVLIGPNEREEYGEISLPDNWHLLAKTDYYTLFGR